MSCITTTSFQIGDLVRVTATFTSPLGVPTDPDAITFRLYDPYGELTVYVYATDAELVRLSEGVYVVDIDAERAGTWKYRFEATGNGQAACEGSFDVDQSEFSNV